MGRPVANSTKNAPRNDDFVEAEQQVIIPTSDNSRIVMLHGDINEASTAIVIMQLINLANISKKPIYVVVSTYGGSIDEMFSLYDTIKFLPCPVYTIGIGKIMSAGVLLLSTGVKGKRLLGKSSRVMIHPISAGTRGNIFEIAADTKEYVRQQDLLIKTLVNETKMSEKQINNIMSSGHDYYMTPEEALKYGIVDKIIG